jgi:hypothetical protein
MPTRRKKTENINSQWEMIKHQKTTWLFPLLTVAVIVVTLGLVLVPQANQILEVREEISVESERHERLVAKRTFLEQLSEPDIDEKVLLSNRALPNNKPVYEIIEALGSELGELGVTLESYELSPGGLSTAAADANEATSTENKPGMMSSLVISFEATGTREAATAFMTRINNLSPLTGLAELSITDEVLGILPLFTTSDSFGMIENLEISGEAEEKLTLEGDLVMYYALPITVSGKVSDELPKKGVTDDTVVERVRALEAYRRQAGEAPLDVDYNREDLFNF